MNHFCKKYPSVYEAKVIYDMQTRQSKGYGFLRFTSPDQAQEAITQMQGQFIFSRPIRLNYAAQRRQPGDNTNRN
jgi:nucleolysin TIA-1/TIAR